MMTVSTWPRLKRWTLAKTANKASAPRTTNITAMALLGAGRERCLSGGGCGEFTL